MSILWIVGEPCIGKSTLIKHLLPEKTTTRALNGTASITQAAGIVVLGSALPHYVVRWWLEHGNPADHVLLDGEPFMHPGVLDLFHGFDLKAVLLEGRHLAQERSPARRQGFTQHQAAMRIAAERWAIHFPGVLAKVLADLPPAILARNVQAFLDAPHPRS